MPRDDRQDPNERFREPRWSESQAREVEAMQPERSSNPDEMESPWTRFIWEQLQKSRQEVVRLSVRCGEIERLAHLVDRMELRSHFDTHQHLVRSTCVYCEAKKAAARILGKPVDDEGEPDFDNR